MATRTGARAAADVVRGTYEWGPRKRRFSEGQIRLALDHLRGWIAAPPD